MKQKIAKILLCLTLLLPGLYTSSVPGFSAVEVVADEQPTGTVRGGVAILITFLLANGMRFVGHFDDIEAGIQELWDDFSAATGNTVSLMNLTAGAVLHLGYLRLNSTVQNAMTAFQNWLVGQNSIPTTGTTDVTVGGGELSFTYLTTCTEVTTVAYYTSIFARGGSGTRFVGMNNSNKYGLYAVWADGDPNGGVAYSTGAGCGVIVTNYSGQRTVNGVVYNVFALRNTGWQIKPDVVPLIPWVQNEYDAITSAVSYTFGADASLGDTSIENETLDLIDGWNIANDQARLLDVAILQALVNRIGLTLDNIDDLIDDIPALYDIPWSTDFPDDPTLVDTPDDTIPWVDMPDSTVPADPSQDIPDTPAQEGEYKILGLERVFPFSLPFDLIALVRVLRASPETPEFDVPMYDPEAGEIITQHVDLHDFDSWAAIMRTGSTLFFLAGLILITRNLIRG